MLRRILPVVLIGAAALVMGAASATLAPSAPSATFVSECEDNARCAHLNPQEWCSEALLDTWCQYWGDPAHPDNPEEGTRNTWTTGSCPFT